MRLYFNKNFINKKKYIIKIAEPLDKKKILGFINKFWKKNHIFIKSKKLFDFQHKGKNKLNWVIAKNKKTQKIEGILGLISRNYYSKGYICKNDDIWIAIIMVAYSLKPSKGLGTEMIKFFYKKFKPNSIAAIGINEAVSNLYKKIGLKIDYLNQYYLKKSNKVNKIKFEDQKNLNVTSDFTKIIKFKNYDQNFKNYKYFLNRYFKHPIYKYHLFIVYEKDIIKNFLVIRLVKFRNKQAIRVVDTGNINLIKIFKKSFFSHLINLFKANHLDFINFGLKKLTIKKIGLKLRKNVFIPHHFEPYEEKNIDVMISYISKDKNFYVFKGDSDLDRPNRINNV
jgi:hypothetical protein